jgi:hypothetical protein
MQIIIDLIQQGKTAKEISQQLSLPLEVAEIVYNKLKDKVSNG